MIIILHFTKDFHFWIDTSHKGVFGCSFGFIGIYITAANNVHIDETENKED